MGTRNLFFILFLGLAASQSFKSIADQLKKNAEKQINNELSKAQDVMEKVLPKQNQQQGLNQLEDIKNFFESLSSDEELEDNIQQLKDFDWKIKSDLFKLFLVSETNQQLEKEGVPEDQRKDMAETVQTLTETFLKVISEMEQEEREKFQQFILNIYPQYQKLNLPDKDQLMKDLKYFQTLKPERKDDLLQVLTQKVSSYIKQTADDEEKQFANVLSILSNTISTDQQTPNPKYDIPLDKTPLWNLSSLNQTQLFNISELVSIPSFNQSIFDYLGSNQTNMTNLFSSIENLTEQQQMILTDQLTKWTQEFNNSNQMNQTVTNQILNNQTLNNITQNISESVINRPENQSVINSMNDQLNQTNSNFTVEGNTTSESDEILSLVLKITVILALLGGGGYFLYRRNSMKSKIGQYQGDQIEDSYSQSCASDSTGIGKFFQKSKLSL